MEDTLRRALALGAVGTVLTFGFIVIDVYNAARGGDPETVVTAVALLFVLLIAAAFIDAADPF